MLSFADKNFRVGIDVVLIAELDRLLSRDWFLKYTYSPRELNTCKTWHRKRRNEFLAGRFCAKEAIYKALPSSHCSAIKLKPWQISVDRGADNEPTPHIQYPQRHIKPLRISISITHKENICAAFAVVFLSLSDHYPTPCPEVCNVAF